jgi:cytochrome c oxidase subunit III
MSDEHPPEPIYADPAQRTHSFHLGMWVFLGSETLLFAGLFALYASYRAKYPDSFIAAIHHNNDILGTANTVILLISSFCVAFAVFVMRSGMRRACLIALGCAMFLGLCFLGVKFFEYRTHLEEGFAPGVYYSSTELPQHGARMFFTLYYFMTGLHALHVIAGLAVLGWIASRVYRRITVPEHSVELDLGGLYWHLVDVVWIFLWPLLYLLD